MTRRGTVAGLALALAIAAGRAPLPAAAAPAAAEGPARGAAEQYKDEILLVGQKAPLRNIEVLSETYEQVSWKTRGGQPQSRAAAEVASVTYADAPDFFVRGLEAWKAGRYGEAEQEFSGAVSAVEAGKAREWCRGRSKGYIADCRRRLAARAKSPAEFLKLVQSSGDRKAEYDEALALEPKSPILDVLLTGKAEAYAGAGNFDDALRTADELKGAASAARLPLWEVRGRSLRGRLLERKGDAAGAAAEFADLASYAATASSAAVTDPELRRELDRARVDGMVRQGWALLARAEKSGAPGDLDAARTWFSRLPGEAGGVAAAKAAAENGLGAVSLLEKKPKDALDRFLKVEVLMFAVPEEQARALWYKSKALEALGDAPGRETALKELQELYAWSEWAGRAR